MGPGLLGDGNKNLAMGRADLAWRRAVSDQTIADVQRESDGHDPGFGTDVRTAFTRA